VYVGLYSYNEEFKFYTFLDLLQYKVPAKS
jgi:hypothetical protein